VILTSALPPARHAFGLTVLAALLLSGCAGSSSTTAPGLPDAFPNHSADQIRTQIVGASDTVRSYSAKARVNVQTPRQNQSFNAVVRHQRADSLFMRFSLFGVEGGRLLLTQDSVFFYDTRNAVLRKGPVEAVQQLFPAPVSSAQFFDNMIGVIAPAARPDWSIQSDSTLYYLSDPGDRKRYTVDPIRWRVVRYEKRSDTGTVLQKRLFSDFRSVDGLVLPGRLMFQQPADDLRAVVTYKEMTLNPSDLSFRLNVPDQVPRRSFR
jgi:outer membrane lipoprotein-sorting protein